MHIEHLDHNELVTKGFEFVSYLPELRTFALHNVFWPNFPSQSLPAAIKGLAAISPSVERLYLSGGIFYRPRRLLGLRPRLSHISLLALEHIHWEGDWSHWHPPPTPIFRGLASRRRKKAVKLTQLNFTSCTSSRVVMDMVARKDLFTLALEETDICWDVDLTRNLSTYTRLFDSIGPDLNAIELST